MDKKVSVSEIENKIAERLKLLDKLDFKSTQSRAMELRLLLDWIQQGKEY